MTSTNPAQIAAVRLAVTTALIDGDPASAFHMVQGLMAQGVPFDVVLFDVVAAAHADFGTRWKDGDYRIADEHAASGAVETLVAMLAGSFDLPEEDDLIVLAAAQGDHHALPLRLASAYLLSLGYRVRFLGANMDADDLAGYLTDESPRALLLSCAMPVLLPVMRVPLAVMLVALVLIRLSLAAMSSPLSEMSVVLSPMVAALNAMALTLVVMSPSLVVTRAARASSWLW